MALLGTFLATLNYYLKGEGGVPCSRNRFPITLANYYYCALTNYGQR